MALGREKTRNIRPLTRRSANSSRSQTDLFRSLPAQPDPRIELKGHQTSALQAEDVARIGTWTANIDTGEVLISEALSDALAFRPAESVTVAKRLFNEIRSVLDDLKDGYSTPLEIEFLYPCRDGRSRVFLARAIALPSARNSRRFLGTLHDVTQQKAVERKLHETQSLLAQAEQTANLGTWEYDVVTRNVIWSEQVYHLLGRCPWEPAAEQTYWSNVHPADLVRVRAIVDEAIRNCREYTFVTRYRLPDGRYRVHYIRGVPIRGVDGKTARLLGIVQDITDQARVEEDLHRLSRELMRARDEERRHMARELHESAGQSLAALKMMLGNLREALPNKNALPNSLLQACVELTNEAVKEVRTISYLMHPPMLDEAGLASALRWYARGFSERSQIQMEVDVPDDFGRESQEIEMTVFRVVQEALTNVHRYSGSKVARISLTRNATEIRAEVQDRGCGLNQLVQSNGHASGVGIAGMRERVLQLRGTFEIESIPGKGTSVRVALPIAPLSSAIRHSTSDFERPLTDSFDDSTRQDEGDL